MSRLGLASEEQITFLEPFLSRSFKRMENVWKTYGKFAIFMSVKSERHLKCNSFTRSKVCSMRVKLGLHRCWRRNVLITNWRCWCRFWPFLSPTSTIQDSLSFSTNIEIQSSTPINLHQLQLINITVTIRPILRESFKIVPMNAFRNHLIINLV